MKMELFEILFALAIWLLVSYFGWKKRTAARGVPPVAAPAETVGRPMQEVGRRGVMEELREIIRQVRGEFDGQSPYRDAEQAEPEEPGAFESTFEVEEAAPASVAVQPPARPKSRPASRSPLAADLMRDLASGPRSLSRAVLLREVLGPPVALREPGSGPPGAS